MANAETTGTTFKTVANDLATCKSEAQLVADEQNQPVHIYKIRAGEEILYGLIVESILSKFDKDLPKGASLSKRISHFNNHLDGSGMRVFVGDVVSVLATFSPKTAKQAKAQPVLLAAKTTEGKKKK